MDEIRWESGSVARVVDIAQWMSALSFSFFLLFLLSINDQKQALVSAVESRALKTCTALHRTARQLPTAK